MSRLPLFFLDFLRNRRALEASRVLVERVLSSQGDAAEPELVALQHELAALTLPFSTPAPKLGSILAGYVPSPAACESEGVSAAREGVGDGAGVDHCLLCSGPFLPSDSIYHHSALGSPAYGRAGLKSHLRCVGEREAAFSSNPRRG